MASKYRQPFVEDESDYPSANDLFESDSEDEEVTVQDKIRQTVALIDGLMNRLSYQLEDDNVRTHAEIAALTVKLEELEAKEAESKANTNNQEGDEEDTQDQDKGKQPAEEGPPANDEDDDEPCELAIGSDEEQDDEPQELSTEGRRSVNDLLEQFGQDPQYGYTRVSLEHAAKVVDDLLKSIKD